MRKLLGMLALCIVAGAYATEVEVKQAPLEYRDVAQLDGGALYANLCASCHGEHGLGDGPAAPALNKEVPDLTAISMNNDGVFPRERVENAINGKGRIVAHGSIDMPVWGQMFMDLRPDWNELRREAFVKDRIEVLVNQVESMQAE